MTHQLTLPPAFNLGPDKELVAFCGGGGKSSLMFSLAGQLPGRLLITSTTHLSSAQVMEAAASLPAEVIYFPNLLPSKGDETGQKIILVSKMDHPEKVAGVPLEIPARLLEQFDFILVEADGARMHPVKAPAAHEPAIPAGATLVVPVIGIDSLDQPIRDTAHRPELLAELLGKSIGDVITVDDLAHILVNPRGGLKNIPPEARVIPAINKVNSRDELDAARAIARQILSEPRVEQVLISQTQMESPVLEVHKRVTAAILAAGESKRMGSSKQLLPWAGTTVLGQTIIHLKDSAVHDILVVTGHEAEAVSEIAAGEGAATVFNERYAEDEMLSSLQTAVRTFSPQTAAVLVILADQPMIGPEIINSLIEAYWQGQGTIIAPQYNGRRGNPVLIDRKHFDELLSLPAGSAPRDLLKRHKVVLVNVDTPTVLQDLDRPQDYERLKP